MTAMTDWWTAHGAGRMKSCATMLAHEQAECSSEAADVEDLQQTMCDALRANQAKQLLECDEDAYRLHVAFVHAHGNAKGELTTLTRPRPPGPNGHHAIGWKPVK